MKEFTVPNLIACPRCGNEALLRKNASKDFQIRCPQCGAHTAWKRKPEAIITWYNMVIQYMRNAGTLEEN